MNPGLVILIGMLVVFFGLFLLIIAIKIMTAIIDSAEKNKKEEKAQKPQYVAEFDDEDIPHDELLAIITAAIAEETKTEAKGFKVISLRRI